MSDRQELLSKMQKNMPVQVSTFLHSSVIPWYCNNLRTLFAVCQGEEKHIKKYLEATPFEYVQDMFIVEIHDATNRIYQKTGQKGPFMDCSIILPVKYGDIFGGHYIFEYEDRDYSIAAGRELFGYPKKFAEINFVENKKVIKGTVIRDRKIIVEVECNLLKPITNVPKLTLHPNLNIRAIGKPDGPGIFSMKIIARDTSPDYKLISEQFGETTVHLEGLPSDPLHELGELGLKKVLGGGLRVGDYVTSEENGWGKVLETII